MSFGALGYMKSKDEVRQAIWKALEELGVADFPRPCFGRIPNFKGSREASLHLRRMGDYRRARCVFCAPDYVLAEARRIVLSDGKTLAAALPHVEKFVEMSPGSPQRDVSIRGLRRCGRPLKTPVDMLILGSVAVDKFGNRLGKGSGYGDREIDHLKRSGLLANGAKLATIVHSTQVVEDMSPLMGEFDIGVDYIVTEQGVIATNRPAFDEGN